MPTDGDRIATSAIREFSLMIVRVGGAALRLSMRLKK